MKPARRPSSTFIQFLLLLPYLFFTSLYVTTALKMQSNSAAITPLVWDGQKRVDAALLAANSYRAAHLSDATSSDVSNRQRALNGAVTPLIQNQLKLNDELLDRSLQSRSMLYAWTSFFMILPFLTFSFWRSWPWRKRAWLFAGPPIAA